MNKNLFLLLVGLLFFQLSTGIKAQNWEWASVTGSNSLDNAYGTATDPNDNVIQVGRFHTQDMQAGPFTLTNQGSSDCFITKYDAGGTLIWSRGYGSSGFDVIRRVATDDQGNIYAVGHFNSPNIDFGNGIVLVNSGGYDAFIIKLDPGGNTLWARSLTGPQNEMARDLTITPCGVIWGGAYMSNTASILGTTITNSPGLNDHDIFMCLLDLNGNLQWVETYGTNGDDVMLGLANRGGRVFATGTFTGSITFGGTTHTAIGGFDTWVANYKCGDPNSFFWSATVGGAATDNIMDITFGDGQVFLTGNSQSSSYTIPGLGTFPLTGGTQQRPVLFSYSLTGTPLWFHDGQSSNSPAAVSYAVEADQCGNVYATGTYSSPGVIWSGTTVNSSSTNSNFILLKYKSDGTLIWANHLPGINNGGIIGTDIAINSLNRAVVAGTLINGATVGGTAYNSIYPNAFGDAFIMQMDNDLTMQLTPLGPICEDAGPVTIDVLPSSGTGTWACPSAPNAINLNATSTNHTKTFDPAAAGPGVHCITFTLQTGGNCPITITECITVLPAPTVTITGSPSVCLYDQPIDLSGFVSPAGGVFAGPGIAGNFFNPAGLGVGPNLVTYTVTNADGCSDFAYLQINVTDSRWHQNSLPSGPGDAADDVITDIQGDVYITGTFTGATTLTDQFGASQTISTNGSSSGMFVAKYARCGDLLWVNHTSSGQVTGTGVTVDDVTGMVYVVGHTDGNTQFQDFCGTNATNMSTTGGYIAQFEMNTGCHLFSEAVATGINPEPEAVVSWEGYLYLTGREEAFVGSGVYNVFATKYVPDAFSGTANQLNAPTWHTFSEPFMPSEGHIGRDIELDLSQAGGERVVITGDFIKDLHFPGTPFIVSSIAEHEAFYAIFEENSGSVQDLQKFDSQPAPDASSGTGVAVTQGGRIFLTGTFKGQGPSDPFQVSSPLNGGANERAYVVFVDQGGWAQELYAGNNGSAQGQAIDASNNEVVVSGNFADEDLVFGSQMVQFNSAPSASKVYTGAFDLAGNDIWTNATASPGNAYTHGSRALALGQNDSYFHVGYYRGDVDYLMDNSYSGVLPYQFLTSMFAIRGSISAGEYFKTVADQVQDQENALEVYPNPSMGRFTLRAPIDNAVVEAYNLQGQRVLLQQGQSLVAGLELDLSAFAKGSYHLRITGSEGEVYSKRIVTQ